MLRNGSGYTNHTKWRQGLQLACWRAEVTCRKMGRGCKFRTRMCLIQYLLTPWSRVLLEKPTGSQLLKKFTAFCGARRFITAFTNACHLSLSWARSIQSIPPHPTSWSSILMLSSHLPLGLPSDLFSLGFPTKTLYSVYSPSYMLHAQPTSFLLIWSPEKYWVRSLNHEGTKIIGQVLLKHSVP